MTGVHRCVRLKTPAMKNRADTSVCPYGKYNFIRTFVGTHRLCALHNKAQFHKRKKKLHLYKIIYYFKVERGRSVIKISLFLVRKYGKL